MDISKETTAALADAVKSLLNDLNTGFLNQSTIDKAKAASEKYDAEMKATGA